LCADSTNRPVDWRWQKALRLRAAGRRPSRRRDDALIARAVEFQAALEVCGQRDFRELHQQFGGFAAAYRIHAAAGNSLATRWELEARLLIVGEPLEAVAGRMGLEVGEVWWYEALFFNVRDRAGRPNYLMYHGIGRRVYTGFGEDDVEVIWKLGALRGGTRVLEDLMQVFRPSAVSDRAQLGGFYAGKQRELAERQAWIAALTLPLDDDRQRLRLIALSDRLAKAERAAAARAADRSAPDGDPMEGIRMVVDAIAAARLASGEHPLSRPNSAGPRAGQPPASPTGPPAEPPEGGHLGPEAGAES
jgi:hypothetical protein